MLKSSDLISWTPPIRVYTSPEQAHVFNNMATYDGKRFVMLYETDDPRYPKLTPIFLQ